MTQINNNELQSSHDSELQTFFYKEKNVRTIVINGEPWWILKDVCDVLELRNPTIVASRLDDDEVTKFNLGGLSGESNIIRESGLYKVIVRSNKSEAKRFLNWVTREVLPSIRRHGIFVTSEKLEEIKRAPNAWHLLFTALKEEYLEKERLLAQINHDKPKILFADAVSVSITAISVADLAKILKGNGVNIGQKRLFERLREDGFLIRREGSDRNSPTQRSMELGLFRIKETAITRSNGTITISKTAKVTGRGQTYFIEYFLGNNGKSEVCHADK